MPLRRFDSAGFLEPVAFGGSGLSLAAELEMEMARQDLLLDAHRHRHRHRHHRHHRHHHHGHSHPEVCRLEVEETRDSVAYHFDAPDMEADDLHVSLDEGMLQVEGHTGTGSSTASSSSNGDNEDAPRRTEKSFTRRLRLPHDVDPDTLEAVYHRGGLDVVVHKRKA